jgi:hypothetical protein
MWLGEFDPASLVDFKFTSRASTGLPTTLAGSPAVSVYKGNSSTESTAGISLSTDFDSRTGLNHVRVDTSTDGTFYGSANDFQVVITSGTVSGVSVVGEVMAHFSIRNRTKVGYKLASDGLDSIPSADPGGMAGITSIPKMIVALFRRLAGGGKVVKDSTTSDIKTYSDVGAVNTTSTFSSTATVDTINKAT